MNDDIMKQTPQIIQDIYAKAKPLLEKEKPDDVIHAVSLVNELLNFKSDTVKLDLDIMLPMAILHEIGHSAILPELYPYVTGTKKIKNAKLIHMFAGAKIAKEILEDVGYDPEKTGEIVDMIAWHDADQVEGLGLETFNTENKKIFHDFDRLETFNKERVEIYIKKYVEPEKMPKVKAHAIKVINEMFYDEIREIAKQRFEAMKELYEPKEEQQQP